MGEVYQATDTRLRREVALKVLPATFASDADRLARFEREAQVLASLNHPHIAAIYGIEEANDTRALVMELVEGETLADRIAKGPVPLDEALQIARQIADALEGAHEAGIIHRDLKPANIKVRADGTVKVLDFGLAKAMDAVGGATDISQSPTLTSPVMMTGVGVILGTAAYMSPEQAKGRPADKRSDVWAFGAVLFEMLSGQRMFQGDDIAETLAAVLRQDVSWTALPASTPASVRRLLARCLDRDVKQRLRDIGEARIVLGEPPASASGLASLTATAPPVWRRALALAAAVLIGAAIMAALLWKREGARPAPVTRFAVTLPEGQQLTLQRQAMAVSPDGTRIVYAADGALFLRSLSDLETRVIPGTGPATHPVFSPDGESLVFFDTNSALKRIAVAGGTPVTVCEVATLGPASISWTGDEILFSQEGPLMRVSAKGGRPEVLLDLNNADDIALNPRLLPDGVHVTFTIIKRTSANMERWDDAQIAVQSLRTGERKTLIARGSDARFIPTGHLVYVSAGTLFAVPFDLSTLEATGEAVAVVEGVSRGSPGGSTGTSLSAHFAFSNTGSLAYVPGPASAGQQELVLFDRKGERQALSLPPGTYQTPRVAPNGRQIVFGTTDGKEAVIWVYELSGESAVRRLTFGGNNRFPVWSGDGRRVAFQSDRDGDPAVFWQPIDGGAAERLTKPQPGASHIPESWSPDGDVLLFSETRDARSSLWAFSIRERKATPFSDVKGSSLPTDAVFSPDGRWVAYQVGESGEPLQSKSSAPIGRSEGTTYVEPFPPTGTKYEIVRGGRPLWSRDGKELFFVPAPGRFMVVAVKTAPTLTFTSPVAVPRGFGVAAPTNPRPFDVMPDGRFVGVGTVGQRASGPARINVVLNWFEELKARVPSRN